jgi:hypothetical protein
MPVKSKLRSLFLCTTLLVGVFGGVPMRAEQIEELMRSMSQPKIEFTIPDEREGDEPDAPG